MAWFLYYPDQRQKKEDLSLIGVISMPREETTPAEKHWRYLAVHKTSEMGQAAWA